MQQAPRRKPGPPAKGVRKQVTLRVPSGHFDVYDVSWRAEGYANLSDYITAVLAEHHGLPAPDYALPAAKPHQQEPLLRAG